MMACKGLRGCASALLLVGVAGCDLHDSAPPASMDGGDVAPGTDANPSPDGDVPPGSSANPSPGANSGAAGANITSGPGQSASGDAGSDAGLGPEEWDNPERYVVIRRGAYLVNSLLACGDCHTPRRQDGTPDTTRRLAGNPNIGAAPLGPEGEMVPIGASNLTPDHVTGIGGWTDDEIKRAFLDGIDHEGKPLVSIMPYYAFHNMRDDDANAIVAYLRSLPAVSHEIPEHLDPPVAVPPIDRETIPMPVVPPNNRERYYSALRGRYLAGETGACIECHTKHLDDPSGPPLDVSRFFAGGEAYSRDALGLSPALPAVIYSANITPHSTGIRDYTVVGIVNTLRTGIAPDGLKICPPMPVGPNGAYGYLNTQDLVDISNYLLSLPPIENRVTPACDLRVLDTPDAGTRAVSSDTLDSGVDGN